MVSPETATDQPKASFAAPWEAMSFAIWDGSTPSGLATGTAASADCTSRASANAVHRTNKTAVHTSAVVANPRGQQNGNRFIVPTPGPLAAGERRGEYLSGLTTVCACRSFVAQAPEPETKHRSDTRLS